MFRRMGHLHTFHLQGMTAPVKPRLPITRTVSHHGRLVLGKLNMAFDRELSSEDLDIQVDRDGLPPESNEWDWN